MNLVKRILWTLVWAVGLVLFVPAQGSLNQYIGAVLLGIVIGVAGLKMWPDKKGSN